MVDIILLKEVIESRVLKEQELEYYRAELERIALNIARLEKELILTQKIISMIETESVMLLTEN